MKALVIILVVGLALFFIMKNVNKDNNQAVEVEQERSEVTEQAEMMGSEQTFRMSIPIPPPVMDEMPVTNE